MLKALFSSTTRIKLLNTFLLNPPGTEFFIRQLTRMLSEQINSIRRELNNLKKIGFLKSKNRDRKKYFLVDTSFIIYPELVAIFQKENASGSDVVKHITKMGKVDLLVLSGVFVGNAASPVDFLVVGDVDKQKLGEYTEKQLQRDKPVRFTVLSRNDFLYRLECNDKFVNNMLHDQKNILAVNKLKKVIDRE